MNVELNERELFAIKESATQLLIEMNSNFVSWIDLKSITMCAEKICGCRIISKVVDFSELLPSSYSKAFNSGACMNVKANKHGKVAKIFINSRLSPVMQRFSLVHELGHLVLNHKNYYTNTEFTISNYVDDNIGFEFGEEFDNPYIFEEYAANIFALMVLIPPDLNIKFLEKSRIKDLSRRYGVTKDAIYSRMLLTSYSASRQNDTNILKLEKKL